MDNKVFNYNINDGFLWSEVNLKGVKNYYIEGYASTIDQDKAGEVLEMSAQEDIYKQIQNENITMDIEHEEWYDAQGKILQRPKNEKIPVAKIVHSEIRPRGVWVKAQINTNLRSFNELWGSIKDGFLKAFSVAFYPTQKNGGIIKHLNLVNITLTGSPVNPNATFAVTMKSASAWMDAELKASTIPDAPKLDNPADKYPENIDNPADAPPSPEVKNEEESNMAEKEFECSICEKEFENKEALAEHKESAHGKEESKKHEDSESSEKEKSEAKVKAEHEEIEAIVKALKEKQEIELKAMRDEIAGLKAELAKPVMKAMVEKEPVADIKAEQKPVSPLNLLR